MTRVVTRSSLPAEEVAGSDAALQVRGIGLRIGGARILDDVNLTVPAGELLGVIGPNGAGKTTLFNVLSGLISPTEGSVVLHGADITCQSVTRRARSGLGRTFQTSSVFPALTVLENVRLAVQARLGRSLSLSRRPRSSDAATTAARQRISDVGLEAHADRPAGALAHGDKRKLEIAMLLAGEPSVILLDEPMAGVATGDVPALVELIRTVHRGHGRTVLMVEHHLEALLGLVDRVAVLDRGQLIACDEPAAVIADPQVQAAYLGEPL